MFGHGCLRVCIFKEMHMWSSDMLLVHQLPPFIQASSPFESLPGISLTTDNDHAILIDFREQPITQQLATLLQRFEALFYHHFLAVLNKELPINFSSSFTPSYLCQICHFCTFLSHLIFPVTRKSTMQIRTLAQQLHELPM